MSRKLIGLLTLAGLAGSTGCIAVGSSREVYNNPRHQAVVVDGDIYLVDVQTRKARKVDIVDTACEPAPCPAEKQGE